MNDFRALAQRLISMPDQLDEGHFRKAYHPVAHVAHGWLKRVTRGAAAILVLDEAGHAGELPPLGRSVLEHVTALRWLVAEGDGITSPLKTTHNRETGKLLDAWRKTVGRKIPEDELAAVLASTEHDDHGRDNFQQFAHRVAIHGNEDDLLTYHALVMESHATYQSSIVYWDSDIREPRDTSGTVIEWPEFAAALLFRGLSAYSAIFIAPPWQGELASIRKRLVALDPDLDVSLR